MIPGRVVTKDAAKAAFMLVKAPGVAPVQSTTCGRPRTGNRVSVSRMRNSHLRPHRICRLRFSDRKIETIMDIGKAGRLRPGTFRYWGGIAPDDSPLVSRDISTQEIYSIKWQFR